jgi:lactoylglutathione lyase
MLSHVIVSVTDFDRALRFYNPVMKALDVQARFLEDEVPWAGWQSAPEPRPLFIVRHPYNQQPHHPGNGQMVAFLATTRQAVDHVYAIALANGGTCEGKPGLRPEYHANYYGAYFRDPDGNKLCIACHQPE